MISESTKPKTQGYPLGAVFLLIAIVACIIAQFSFREIRNSHPTREISYAVGLGAFFGLLFGAIVGLYHYRRTHGFFLGCAVGTVVGAATGPICYFGIHSPWPMMISAAVGGVGLICFAVIYRYINSGDPIVSFASYDKLLPEAGKTSVDVVGLPANLLERSIAAAVVCSLLSGFAVYGVMLFRRSAVAPGPSFVLISQAVATAIACFLLFGMPAIISSIRARRHHQNGAALQSHYAAKQAMTWIRISVAYLLAAFAIATCFVVVEFFR